MKKCSLKDIEMSNFLAHRNTKSNEVEYNEYLFKECLSLATVDEKGMWFFV